MNWGWEAVMEGEQGLDLWGPEELEAEQGQQFMDLELETTRGGELRGLGSVLDFIREDPIGVTIMPASLCPPTLAAGCASSCSWALLDLKAYIADCRNTTTAKDVTRAGHEIQATLCLARPPRVSHLCIHCPTLTPADFGTEPAILAHCDGFIFFKAAICNASVCFEQAMQDFFVYWAPPSRMMGQPSLTRLPHPGPYCNIIASMVGLVRCSDQDEDMDDDYRSGCTPRAHDSSQHHYVIAALNRSKGIRDYTQFDLHRFDSREGKWTTKVLQLGTMKPSPGLTFFFHGTHKVITLGGGFMGWVDLCRGIIFCNVLLDHPELYYIPLPESPEADKEMPDGAAGEFRDIAAVQGCIKYVEHRTKVQPQSCHNGTYISDDWTVTTWRRKFTPDCWQGCWRRSFKCDASQISGSLPMLIGLKEMTPLPPLHRLHTGHPVLSLDADDVVYILAKVDHRDDKAFVLAVNVRDGTLQAADNFGAERTVGISFTYTQYKTSDNFKAAQGKKEKQKKKRPGMLLGSLSNKKPGVEML
ncbi:unnamed protein product [Urochloa humidicola]